jgi:hypothetical protein
MAWSTKQTRIAAWGRHILKFQYKSDSRSAKTIRDIKTSCFGTKETGLDTKVNAPSRIPNTGFVVHLTRTANNVRHVFKVPYRRRFKILRLASLVPTKLG